MYVLQNTYNAKRGGGQFSMFMSENTSVPWLIFLTRQLQRGQVIAVETRSEGDDETDRQTDKYTDSHPATLALLQLAGPLPTNASVNSKHQHPPGDPRGFALYCCPGAGIYT